MSRPGPLEPSIFVVIPGASTVPVTVSAFYVDHDAGALVFRNRNGLATEVWAAGTWKRVRSAD